ncbi:MAG: hypothetical protein HY054_11590 [Proteobacteria bacterium]|nr:hypothetical protein [Pseudomonadota bacterium]
MRVRGDYYGDGYALLEGLLPGEVVTAFLRQLMTDMKQANIALDSYEKSSAILQRAAVEIYGYQYKPMITFLWGLTPIVSHLVGRDLLPTYNYFRIYRRGDICRVHSDRFACEHSLSLTLSYSDGTPWPLEMASTPVEAAEPITPDFGAAPHAALAMNPGDAVLYQGARYRHGRVQPNPNDWSAHMFLHWVDRNGPYAAEAFDQRGIGTVATNS